MGEKEKNEVTEEELKDTNCELDDEKVEDVAGGWPVLDSHAISDHAINLSRNCLHCC